MTQKTIHIPATVEEATAQLGGLGRLLTAKQWERAAIVYAFTEPGENRFSAGKSGRYTLAAFARLNIAGLRDEETVAWMRNAWQEAVDDGATPAKPDVAVELPAREFPKHPRTRSAFDGFAAQIRKNPEAISELVRDDPALIAAVAEQVADHIGLRSAVNEKQRTQQETVREAVYEETHERRDYSADLRSGVNRLMPVLHAMRAGKWQPDVMEQTLISFLAQLFTEIVEGNADSTDVINEIEAYLGAARA